LNIIYKTEVLSVHPTLCLPQRTICSLNSSSPFEPGHGSTSRCKLDSHADTCVAGSTFAIIEHTNRLVDVRGYSAELQTLKGLPIVSAGTVYIDPKTGECFLLVIHECIFFRDRLRNSLLCPNQMRAHGVTVNDVPTQFDATSTHSIITNDLTIPLDMLGVVSFFDSSLPQPGDFDTLPWVTLTAPANWVDYASTLFTNERRVPDRISLLSSQVTYQPAQLEPLHIDRSICVYNR
jgi:hypothetical protein